MTMLERARRQAMRLGLDVQRLDKSVSHYAQTLRLLDESMAAVVCDVGANAGQFATEILAARPTQRIVSFEPLSAAHSALSAAAQRHKGWLVAERMALGADTGEAEINISVNSVSSSLLSMLDSHVVAAPSSAPIAVERVPLRRLDDVLPPYLRATDRIYLKIDTQGYEAEVLKGIVGIEKLIAGIQVEMSFMPLYQGQPLFDDILSMIRGLGFRLWGVCNGFRDARSGELLQVDGFFSR